MPVVQLPHWPTWLWAFVTVLVLIFLYHVTIGGRGTVAVKGGR